MSPRALLRAITAGHAARRVGLILAWLVVVLALIGLVLLSPLLLAALDPNSGADWERLANIAQTYAAISAVLALLALGGVAISLVLQAREMHATREQALRVLHTDLLKMALENPQYLRSWGPSRTSLSDEERSQIIYVNLIVSLWEMMYEIGGMNDIQLRVDASRLLRGEVGQQFWREARDDRLAGATSKRSRRFHEIIDAEYQKATEPAPPEPEDPESSDQEESEQEPPEQPLDGK